MKQSINLLLRGFESSSGLTEEFKDFFKVFKREISKELRNVGASNINLKRGHFYISGFFTIKEQAYYISLPDVRDIGYGLRTNSNSCMNQLLYRTAKDYKDFNGGSNNYVKIENGMCSKMNLHF